jgi:Ser/Thr protein kinase RdoA (MazF antagonist)
VGGRQSALDTVLDDVVLSEIGAHYDVGQWWDVHAMPGGFRVAAEAGDFLVAVAAGQRTDAALRFEAMLLAHLEDRAYPAPRLVRTRAGRSWHRSVTGAGVLVSEWVQGGVVDASLAHHRRRSMRTLAAYHGAVRSFPPRLRADSQPTLSRLEREGPAALQALTGLSGWYLDADGRHRLGSAASYLWRQYVRLPELRTAGGVSLPRLVIHGAFRRSGVVLGGNGFPADGLAGFGRARFDMRAVDLAAAVKTFARGAGGFDLNRCADLMAAYDEVEPLAPGEVEAVPAILRVEGLVRVLRVSAGAVAAGVEETVVHDVVEVIQREAARLRWLEEHEPALVEALASSCVG